MTNLHLALLSALVSLVTSGVGFYFIRAHITRECGIVYAAIHSRSIHTVNQIENAERSLRSHVVDEVNALVGHVTEETRNVENNILDFVKTHADELSAAASAIKAHSIETHDRAVSRDISPRQAVTRT